MSQLKRLYVIWTHAAAALVLEGGNSHFVEIGHEQADIFDRLVTRYLPKFGTQKPNRWAAIERAGQLPLCILLDLNVSRIGRICVDAHCFQSRTIGIDAKIKKLQCHG